MQKRISMSLYKFNYSYLKSDKISIVSAAVLRLSSTSHPLLEANYKHWFFIWEIYPGSLMIWEEVEDLPSVNTQHYNLYGCLFNCNKNDLTKLIAPNV